MDYSNYPGGGPGVFSPSRRSSVKTAKLDEDDQESISSEQPPSCFGFVAYSMNNPGEKPRVTMKTTSHQHAYSGASWSDRSLTPSLSSAASPGSIPSPRSMFQPERDKEDRHERHSKKRRAKECNFSDPLDLLWLG